LGSAVTRGSGTLKEGDRQPKRFPCPRRRCARSAPEAG